MAWSRSRQHACILVDPCLKSLRNLSAISGPGLLYLGQIRWTAPAHTPEKHAHGTAVQTDGAKVPCYRTLLMLLSFLSPDPEGIVAAQKMYCRRQYGCRASVLPGPGALPAWDVLPGGLLVLPGGLYIP